MTLLSTAGFILFVLALLLGLALVPLGFPGTWLVVATAFVYSLARDFQPGKPDFWVLLIVIVLALLGEAVEYGIGVIGSKKLNVSSGAIIASIAGGFVGAIIGVPVFLVGALLGLFLGAFLGAFLYEIIETKKIKPALWAATATFFSRVTAMFVKTFVALVMVIYLLTKSL